MGNNQANQQDLAFSTVTETRRSFVEGQYEHLWQGVSDKFEKSLSLGEKDLSRMHLFMRRNFGPRLRGRASAQEVRRP